MQNAGEKAMALVDGQLAPAEVPELVQELARNAPLVAELQRYLALSPPRIAAPYAAMGDEPVPARLIDTVMTAPMEAPVAASRRAQPSALARTLEWLQGGYRVPAWSLAAAPALAAAVVVLAVSMAAPGPGRGGGLPLADLAAAIERTGSGKDQTLVTLRPVLSFASKAAGWCRQFEVRYPGNRQVAHALACRGGDGRWNIVASTPPGPLGMTPAGADPRKGIDDLVTAMMRSGPLSPADEAAAIEKGWR